MLKLSGEIFAGEGVRGFARSSMDYFANEIIGAYERNPGIQMALMPGGGNHGRGSELISQLEIDPLFAHIAAMGFLNVNMLIAEAFLLTKLPRHGIEVCSLTTLQCEDMTRTYRPKIGRSKLGKGKFTIIGGGSGEPFKSTDYATAIKCAELACDRVLKGTKVEGVFTHDPRKEPERAKRIPRMTPREFLERGLGRIYDPDGVIKLGELRKPLQIFDFFKSGNLARVIAGELVDGQPIGTIIEATQ